MDFSSELTRSRHAAHLNALSVAPMVGHTDRHCRRLLRLIAPRATLYTEMIVAQAVVRGDATRLLALTTPEHPVIAQLGDSDPARLAEAALVVEEYGYDAVNLNVGCPSKRVAEGGFGACLMERPQEAAAIVRSMKRVSKLPVTVKCRLGTDRVSGYPWLKRFVLDLQDAGVDGVVVHARIADLSGRSTRFNLNVPPLDWHMVERLQQDVEVPLTLNGGVKNLCDIQRSTKWIDRVMVGRVALKRPDILAEMHDALYHDRASFNPMSVCLAFRDYIVEQLAMGVPLRAMTRHMLALFHGVSGAKVFRQHLSTHAKRPSVSIGAFDDALEHIHLETYDAPAHHQRIAA